MSPEMIQAIAEAFGLPPDSTFEDVVAAVSGWLKQVQDAANGNAPPPATDADADPSADAPADPAAMNIVKRLGQVYALALHKRGSDKELGAFRSEVLRRTNVATATEAFGVMARWEASHLSLVEKEKEIATKNKLIEDRDRLTLVRELVTCGAETPATAYDVDKDGITDPTKIAPMFARMTVAELKDRVEKKKSALKSGGGGGNNNGTTPITPPTAAGDITVTVKGQAVTLNAHDQKFCKDNNITHEARALAKLRLTR